MTYILYDIKYNESENIIQLSIADEYLHSACVAMYSTYYYN